MLQAMIGLEKESILANNLRKLGEEACDIPLSFGCCKNYRVVAKNREYCEKIEQNCESQFS